MIRVLVVAAVAALALTALPALGRSSEDRGVNAKGKIVPKGDTSTVTAKLQAGKYEFYCTVPGHAAAGMKGTLTVT